MTDFSLKTTAEELQNLVDAITVIADEANSTILKEGIKLRARAQMTKDVLVCPKCGVEYADLPDVPKIRRLGGHLSGKHGLSGQERLEALAEACRLLESNRRCNCYATVSEDDPRHDIWQQLVNGQMPLKHPLLVRSKKSPKALFYVGDGTRLTEDARMHLALDPQISTQDLASSDVFYIKAENVTVFVCQTHLRCRGFQ